MSKLEILFKIAEKYGGRIETRVAVQYGVSRATLSVYCKQNKLKRVGYGIYTLAETEKDLYFYLQQNAKKFLFSHETALFLQNLIKDEPKRPTITVVSGATPPVMLSTICDVYYIKREVIELGKQMVMTPHGNEVFVYDLERTICDMVRSRKRIGEEKVLQSIKAYLSFENKDMERLFIYAEQFHISSYLYKFLEQAEKEYSEKIIWDR